MEAPLSMLHCVMDQVLRGYDQLSGAYLDDVAMELRRPLEIHQGYTEWTEGGGLELKLRYIKFGMTYWV